MLTMSSLEKCFRGAIKNNVYYIAVKIQMKDFNEPQVIIDSNVNFEKRLAYYKKIFNEDLVSEQGNKIVGFTYADSFEDIEYDLECC